MQSLLFITIIDINMRRIIAVLALAILASCAQEQRHGHMFDEEEKAGKLSRGMKMEEVEKLLGSPSLRSSVNPQGRETWYYMQVDKRQRAFLNPHIEGVSGVAVSFSGGIVNKLEDINDANRTDISVASGKTPTRGKEVTILNQLLGNLGRFNPEGR